MLSADIVQRIHSIVELLNAGRFAEAEVMAVQGLELHPQQPQLMLVLGIICITTKRFDEAVDWLGRAAVVSPEEPKIWGKFGYALKSVGRPAEGLAAYDKALALEPANLDVRHNRAVLLAELLRIDEALAEFTSILNVKPDWAEVHFSRALALLLSGQFEAGWPEFEWLWQAKSFPYWKRVFPYPRWDGISTEGKTILLHGGQGFGDTVQFVRYATLLARTGATVLVEAHPKQAQLLGTVPGVSRIIPIGDEVPHADFHAPLMALPGLMRTTLATVPAEVPYISVDAALAETWRRHLGPPDGRPRVGLVWAGEPGHSRDRQRSLRFEELGELFSAPVKWFSLQVGRNEALAHLPDGLGITDLSPPLTDFTQTAAAVSQLDLVISVDTSVAHVAGAMARPVWVFLPFCPDFRWMLDRTDSPWYPTMRLFRERRYDERRPVISEMARALNEWAGSFTSGPL